MAQQQQSKGLLVTLNMEAPILISLLDFSLFRVVLEVVLPVLINAFQDHIPQRLGHLHKEQAFLICILRPLWQAFTKAVL